MDNRLESVEEHLIAAQIGKHYKKIKVSDKQTRIKNICAYVQSEVFCFRYFNTSASFLNPSSTSFSSVGLPVFLSHLRKS